MRQLVSEASGSPMSLPLIQSSAFSFDSPEEMIEATLGGIESLATHPATSSHGMVPPRERDVMGIREGLVRISVGLEDVDDLLDDIDRALRGSGEVPS